jgi:hypothetical protein
LLGCAQVQCAGERVGAGVNTKAAGKLVGTSKVEWSSSLPRELLYHDCQRHFCPLLWLVPPPHFQEPHSKQQSC